MKLIEFGHAEVRKYLKSGKGLSFATRHYPSRGQSTVQELYRTKIGKIFLKRVSLQNHKNCQIDPRKGTLAEREAWSFRLARHLDLNVPELLLLDRHTTVQTWLDLPDGHIYSSIRGRMVFRASDVFDCGIFDWLTGQMDRHDANYLYDYVHQKIILIDSSFCFLKYDGSLPDYLKFFEVGSPVDLRKKWHSALCLRLKKTTDSELLKMVPLRDKEERDALVKRKRQCDLIHMIQEILDLYRGVRA